MNPNTIREFASSFQKSRILLSGFELDLFTNIEQQGSTANQISTTLNLNEHACERLLNALVSLGFLTKQNLLFFNTEESFAFLSRKGSDYLGGLMHSNHLWNTWSNLSQVVRTGKSAHPKKKWRRRASAIAASNHGLEVGCLRHIVHSTVTLFARFRGLSTSVPFTSAT